MNPQYQPPQGHGSMEQGYYQPTYVPGKEQTLHIGVGGPPQAMGYPPGQQQFAPGIVYHNGYSPPAAASSHPAPCFTPVASSGAKRSTCLALLAATVILLAAAVVGLGAGLGVSQRNLHSTQADLARATGSPSAAATVFMTATSITSSATPTATATTNILCPKTNNTLYTTTTTTTTTNTPPKQFREFCGIDYGDTESEAVGTVKVASMDACLDACARQDNCTGAGWGDDGSGQGAEHTCYMKRNLTTPHGAVAGWAFGVLLTGSDSSSSSERRSVVWPWGWEA